MYERGGRLRASIDATGYATHFVYDAVGRLTTTIHPAEGEILQQLLDVIAPGEIVATVDWTQLIYPDAIPTYLTDNLAVTTEYTRDSRIQASIDERGNRTEYRYDALGRLTETIYADETPNDLSNNPRMTVTYDAAGRRTAETDALGYTTRYIYDNLGRVAETIFQGDTRMQVDDDDADCCDYCGRSVTLPRRHGNKSDRLIGNRGCIGPFFADKIDDRSKLGRGK